MFTWNEPDCISALETAPEVDEYGTVHTFRVARDGLTLELSVNVNDGDVVLTLRRDGVDVPAFYLRLTDCPGARRVVSSDGDEYLEFAAARVFGGRYDGESHVPQGVRVAARPHIAVRLF